LGLNLFHVFSKFNFYFTLLVFIYLILFIYFNNNTAFVEYIYGVYMLHYAMLHYTILHYTMLYYTILQVKEKIQLLTKSPTHRVTYSPIPI